jgi:hypothetical protein
MAGTPNTGNATNTFGIDNTQRYSVIAQTYCRRITVQENFNSATPPTADLVMSKPAGATQIAVAKGTPAIFTASASDGISDGNGYFYKPGQIVGDIETASGSITVQQVESNQV